MGDRMWTGAGCSGALRVLAAISVLAVAGCGGGGGGGGNSEVVVSDANGLTQAVAISVGDNLADKVTGSPPAPTDVTDAPVASADVSSTSVRSGDKVDIPLSVRSTSDIANLFAKIPGAASYFQVSAPSGGKRLASMQTAKAATTQKFQFSITVPSNVADGQFCIGLSAQDADMRVSNVATVCLSVVDPTQPAGNQAPHAGTAGDQRVLPGTAVTLDGSASEDLDGSIVSYAWTQVQGPAVDLLGADTAVASFTAPDLDGVSLAFVLTVTDDAGDAGSASVTVFVTTVPAVVSFDLDAETAAESAGTVSLSLSISPPSDQDITLPFTVGGTASGADRSVTTSPLLIPAGTTNTSVLVSIVDDALVETDETVVLTLQSPTGAVLGDRTVNTLTIQDNESAPLQAATLFVVDEQYRLLSFAADSPQTFSAVDVTGVEPTGVDNTLPLALALEFRPATGELYLYTSDRRFYRIDVATGVATLLSSTPPDVTTDFLLGLGFNPCIDGIRAIGDAGENFRFAADTSFLARDGDLAYAQGDVNQGNVGAITDIAYTPCVQGKTTLYGIETTLDSVVRIGSPGGSPTSPDSGEVNTIADLSVPIGGAGPVPFGIDSVSGMGYVLDGDGINTTVYQLDVQTGQMTNLGIIGDGSADLRAGVLAVQP